MNYGSILQVAIKKQGMNLKLNQIPFNIFLKNTGDILRLCFLEDENNEYIIVSETNDLGYEEIRIIPKENIEYVSIFYDFSEMTFDEIDKMII